MRGIINLSAIILSATVLSQKTKRPLVTSLPTVWCSLMIVLQLLSCFHALSTIDILSLLTVIGLGVYLYVRLTKKEMHYSLKELFLHPSLVVFILITLCTIYLARNAMVHAWDDVNYWGASVRALYERNGLEGKYYTVSADWGDYPLGQQLIEWWFVHSFSKAWRENLLFIGYYILIFSFLAPLSHRVSNKILPILGTAIVCMILVFVHVDNGNLFRLNADLLMAMMFGSCVSYILQITDYENGRMNRVDVLSVSIQLAGITMVKSIGIFWSIAAAVLYYLLRTQNLEKHTLRSAIAELKWYDYFLLVPASAVYVFWLVICKILERETYLVNNLRSAEIISIEWHLRQAKMFISTVFFEPATQFQVGKINIGISLGALIFLPILFYFYFRKRVNGSKKRLDILFLYSVGISGLYLLILLFTYETMFAYEPQAIDSVFRYALPCVVLIRVSLWHMYKACPSAGRHQYYGVVIMGLILGISYNTLHLPGQIRDIVLENHDFSKTRVKYEEKYDDFYIQLAQMDNRYNASVCYFSEGVSEYDRIHLCYLAEGTAVNLNSNLDPEKMPRMITRAHATHVIVYSNGKYTEADYQTQMAEGQVFEFGKLYKVEMNQDGKVSLQTITS